MTGLLFLGAVLVASALLVVTGIGVLGNGPLGTAATIGTTSINRTDFRARASVLEAISAVRSSIYGNLVLDQVMTADQANALEAAAAPNDIVGATVRSLVDDSVIQMQAAKLGLHRQDVSGAAEVARALEDQAFRRVRWLELNGPLTVAGRATSYWPVANGPATPDGASTDAITYGGSQLSNVSMTDLVTAARSAGWDALGSETWIPSDGDVSGMPAVLVWRLRRARIGSLVGPFRDEVSGAQVVGLVVAEHPQLDPEEVQRDLAATGLDLSGLGKWATSQTLERAVAARMVSDWTSQPTNVVTASEVVVGAASNSGSAGPFVGLASLLLSPAQSSSRSSTTDIAAALRELDEPDRERRWDDLVAAANARPGVSGATRSGDLGWVSQADLLPAVGNAAFSSATKPGDVLGPISTSVGPELFLVRGFYAGSLDDVTNAALTEAMSSADLDQTAAALSAPFPDVRYTVGVVRAEPEVAGNSSADQALFGGPLGVRSGPYVADGTIIVAVPRSRVESIPSGQVRERIEAGAFATWLVGQAETLTTSVEGNPLGLPDSSQVAPALSFSPAQTPYQPVIPGLPSP